MPMLKDDEVVGVLAIYRQEVRPFTDKQIALVQNFAAQAVIAIENTRLLNELRQSLQQQTATADVLKVISRSTFDLQAVLDTLTESASRLCAADTSHLQLLKNGLFHNVASYRFPPEHKLSHEQTGRAGSSIDSGRVAVAGKSVHVPDVQLDPKSAVANRSRSGGVRTILAVPLIREGNAVGVLCSARLVRPFNEKQIALV